MSLQKQLVHLNLTGGLQKKDDQFLVIPSKLAQADNVEFVDASSVILRGGQSRISPTPISGAPDMDYLWRMFEFQGQAGIECESSNGLITPSGIRQVLGNRAGSYVGNPADPDNVPRCVATTTRAGRASRRTVATTLCKVQHDSNSNATHRMTAWEEQSGDGAHTISYRIESLTDPSAVVVGSLTGPDGTYINVALSPRILPSATGFWLCCAAYNYFAGAPSAFSVNAIPITNAGVVSAGTTIFTSAATGAIETAAANAVLFDASASNASGAYQYGFAIRDTNAGGTLTLTARDAAMAALFTKTLVPSALPRSLTAFITYVGATTRVHAFFGVGTASVRSCFANAAAMSAEIAVGTPPAGYLVGRIAVGSGAAHGSDIMIGYDAAVTPYTNGKVYFSKFSATHATLSECPGGMDGWYVAGHITTDTGRAMMPMQVFTADTTSTLYVVDLSNLTGNWGGAALPPNVMARVAIGECVSPESPFDFPSRRLPSGAFFSTGYQVSFLRMGRDLVTVNGRNETSWDVSILRLSARYSGQLGYEEINNLTYLAGACPYVFDGVQFVEEGFHHAPQIINNGSAAAAGPYGPFAAGTASFVFTEAWTDAQGNFHESAPSTAVTVTFTGPLPYLSVTVVRPPTRKPGSKLRVYRTKISSTDTSLYLTVTESGTVVTSDVTLASSEQLYTAGNVLPNTPAPACRDISTFQRRLVLTGCEEGERVYWSKQSTPGYAVEFTVDDPTHQTQLPDTLGNAVCSEEMDGKLFVVADGGVGVLYGNGPDPTGTQGQYSDVSTIITEIGCDPNSPRSLVRTPEGLWFRATQGLRLITRSGTLGRSQDGKYAGSEVDSLVSGPCVGVVSKSKQQARFYQTDNSVSSVLVWDFQWQQWTRFTGVVSADAVATPSEVYHGTTDASNVALVRRFNDAAMQDVNTSVSTVNFSGVVKTPWLSFAGIQGFQRLYRLMLLGQAPSTCNFNIVGAVTYDFDDTRTDSFTAPFVAPSSGRVQIQHHFAVQKCESAQITLTLTTNDPAKVGRLRLTDLTLQVGAKGGYFKLPSSQRF